MKNNEQEKLNQLELAELFKLRNQLAETMKILFGAYQEKMERIVFKDWKNKKLAEILDCSNIGRYLQKPNLNDRSQPKQDAFQGLITKVKFFAIHLEKPLTENVKLRKMTIAIFFALTTISIFCGWLSTTIKTANNSLQLLQSELTAYQAGKLSECRMTKSERYAITDLFGQHIQFKLALETVKFQDACRKKIYTDSLQFHLNEFRKRFQTEIVDSRKILRHTNLKAENGQYLIDVFEEVSVNNIDENFNKLAIAFTDVDLPVSNLIDIVVKKIKTVQNVNRERFDSAVSPLLKQPINN